MKVESRRAQFIGRELRRSTSVLDFLDTVGATEAVLYGRWTYSGVVEIRQDWLMMDGAESLMITTHTQAFLTSECHPIDERHECHRLPIHA